MVTPDRKRVDELRKISLEVRRKEQKLGMWERHLRNTEPLLRVQIHDIVQLLKEELRLWKQILKGRRPTEQQQLKEDLARVSRKVQRLKVHYREERQRLERERLVTPEREHRPRTPAEVDQRVCVLMAPDVVKFVNDQLNKQRHSECQRLEQEQPLERKGRLAHRQLFVQYLTEAEQRLHQIQHTLHQIQHTPVTASVLPPH